MIDYLVIREMRFEDINRVKLISDDYWRSLGRIRTGAFINYVKENRGLVALVDSGKGLTPEGFLIFGYKKSDNAVALYKIAVSGFLRRQGIGSALLCELKRTAIERGFSRIYTKCPAILDDASMFFYKHGFYLVDIEYTRRKNLSVLLLDLKS